MTAWNQPAAHGTGTSDGITGTANAHVAGRESRLRPMLRSWAFRALLAVLPGFLCAQQPAYIGFVFPAGGRQGTVFRCTLGGQALDGVNGVIFTGSGVTGRVIEYNRHMNSQEVQLLREQLDEIRAMPKARRDAQVTNLASRLEMLIGDYVQQPQCASIANLVTVEVAVERGTPPGPREIRLVTPRGVSNPLAFHVGALPEVTSEPLPTSPKQILGKEAQSLRSTSGRKRGAAGKGRGRRGMVEREAEMIQMVSGMAGRGALTDVDDREVRIMPPCTVNGQIASGSVDRYRFDGRSGQRLVVTVQARALVPYLADAVPGWFQPVLVLCDAQGREKAYNDDYRFHPDPVLYCELSANGEYVLAIHDAIFRGREDFVYRMTIGELPFVTSVFPLGGQAGVDAVIEVKGFHLAETRLTPDLRTRLPGLHTLTVAGSGGLRSNPFVFEISTLPDGMEHEPNNTLKRAQPVTLPIVMNGTIGMPGDLDVFTFRGRAGQEVVAEVRARRLGSPLDAWLKIMDDQGRTLAWNDDQEDPGSGLDTHHADAYVRVTLPADGAYAVQLRDTQHQGGEAFGYRLRLSEPQPDFDLRVVPSRVVVRRGGETPVTAHALRKDGFAGPITFRIREPAAGFEVRGATLTGTQTVARLMIRARQPSDSGVPVPIVIQGVSGEGEGAIIRDAVAAEDCMQAFLWRHLVPAQEFLVLMIPGPPRPSGKPGFPAASRRREKPE
ncbi:MAG TPA: hypothetical protein PLJ32_07405 [Kiritimatiellia bacterium]|nr:hypothetical protein [Kiritimatiellia bacterium]